MRAPLPLPARIGAAALVLALAVASRGAAGQSLGPPPDSLLDPMTVTVSPLQPTTADPIRIHIQFDPAVCFPAVPIDPPTLDAERRTIVIRSADVAPPPLHCDPHADVELSVPALAAGTWSIDVLIDTRPAARAFEVRSPSSELYLQDGRFVAAAFWKDSHGVEHQAAALPLGDRNGAFWFFGPDNVELTLKVLDGRSLNGRFWVFIASMTDVAYRVSIVDRSYVCVAAPCGNERTYEGAAGHNGNVLDISAFPDTPGGQP